MTKILVTGSNGLVGSALTRELNVQGYDNISCLTRNECNLLDFARVKEVLLSSKPEVVFHTAAAVYGIGGNQLNKGSIFLDNVLINTHVIEASRLAGVKKIIVMGTVAAYPEPKVQPVSESRIWDGPPHGSENSYGHAKRAALAQLEAYAEQYGMEYVYVISTNLYGPNDRFDVNCGHVIPSLIRKFYDAKKSNLPVEIWGDGTAARDFLYSRDMARALCSLMKSYVGSINVASGKKVLIRDIVNWLTDYFDMHEKVSWNSSKPNGREYYELDLTNLKKIGFEPRYDYRSGLSETLSWFCKAYESNSVRN